MALRHRWCSLSQMLYDFGKVASRCVPKTPGCPAAGQRAGEHRHHCPRYRHRHGGSANGSRWSIPPKNSSTLSSIGKLTRQRNDEGATSLSDVVQTDARIEGPRPAHAVPASLDSARATLMSFLGWNTLNEVGNDFPQKLARSCDIAEPDDRLVPAVLAARRRRTSRRPTLITPTPR